jgi:signal transduction histidine kinase
MEMDGRKILIIAGRLSFSNQSYDVYFSKDITHVYEGMQDITSRVTAILFVAISTLSILLLIVIRFALLPVRSLSKAAARIAAGDFSERVPIVSNDEVGILSGSFNQMAEAVETHIKKIEQTSDQRKLLLSSLTHELKTPMTAIIGYADSMLHFKMNSNQQERAVEQIYEQCRRMERLSQKLMNIISLDAGEQIEKLPVTINNLFQEACNTVKSNMREKEQTIETEDSLATITADNDLLLCLLVNLLDNAIKASSKGAVIGMRAYKIDRGRPVLEVFDHGVGIPKNEIDNIAEPFYRVDRSRSPQNGGIGLGLYLCAIVARKHDAELLITSSDRQGTCVKVIFQADEGGDNLEP